MDNVMMVEGEAKECQEADLMPAIKVGHEAIKVHCRHTAQMPNLVEGEKATVKRVVEPLPVKRRVGRKVKMHAVIRSMPLPDLHPTRWPGFFDKVAEEFVAQLEAEMGETYESAIGTETGKYIIRR